MEPQIMKYKDSLLYLYGVLILLLIIGTSACSQKKQPDAKTHKNSVTEPTSVTMYMNPDCRCCSKWTDYMEENGFSITEKPTDKLDSVKEQHGVPNQLGTCHTALIDGYVVEGHVPLEAINKLLKERPDAKGIAVPGMPAGAPGAKGNRSAVDVFFFNGLDQVAYFDKF